jgi:hypothetical protein
MVDDADAVVSAADCRDELQLASTAALSAINAPLMYLVINCSGDSVASILSAIRAGDAEAASPTHPE